MKKPLTATRGSKSGGPFINKDNFD